MDYKKDINNILTRYDILLQRRDTNKLEIDKMDSERKLMSSSVDFLTSFAEWMREKIKIKLETLVNSALSIVFPDKQMEFKLISKRTKTGLQYETYIETNGTLTPVFDAKGGGVLDIITIALRISYLKLYQGQVEQVLFLDEPFKNLDKERIHNAVAWLSRISKELNIQLIMVTHIEELSNAAENLYRVTNVDNVSQVERLVNNGRNY